MPQQLRRTVVQTEPQQQNEWSTENRSVQPVDRITSEIPKHAPAKPRSPLGISSEHYHRAVAQIAYGLWEERGHAHGEAEADWHKAEAALKPLWSADLSYASTGSTSDNTGKL